MAYLSKEAILNQIVPIERQGGTFFCQLQKREMGFCQYDLFPNESGCKLAAPRPSPSSPYIIPKESKKWGPGESPSPGIFFPHSGKPAILVGVSRMEQNAWKPFKWLVDNLIKENASSHHTPPTVDKWCHLLWKYFTKHFPLETVSNSDFKIKHVAFSLGSSQLCEQTVSYLPLEFMYQPFFLPRWLLNSQIWLP